jgi:hypothetical protein
MSDKVIPLDGPGATPRARLIFAVDVAASRAPTWDTVCELQSKMFASAVSVGELAVQFVSYNGMESCHASKWMTGDEQFEPPTDLIECHCRRHCTEVAQVLEHALREHDVAPIQAVALIAGAVDESLAFLAPMAQSLGERGVPLFIFHNDSSRDIGARRVFRHLALKSGGTYFESDPGKLSEQIGAVARVAVGDVGAIERITGSAPLTDQSK